MKAELYQTVLKKGNLGDIKTALIDEIAIDVESCKRWQASDSIREKGILQKVQNQWEEVVKIAAESGDAEIVLSLFDARANVLPRNFRFDKILLIAAKHGHVNILKSFTFRKEILDEILKLAVENGHQNILSQIMPKDYDNEGLLLTLACVKGKLDIVKQLIALKAGPYSSPYHYLTKHNYYTMALYKTASTGNLEIVKLLLQTGADPHYSGGIGCEVRFDLSSSTLAEAAENGHTEIFKTLITAGADIGNATLGEDPGKIKDDGIKSIIKKNEFNMVLHEFGTTMVALGVISAGCAVVLLFISGADLIVLGIAALAAVEVAAGLILRCYAQGRQTSLINSFKESEPQVVSADEQRPGR